MAYEMLSVKLAELDGRIGRLHGRIQRCQSLGRTELRQETRKIRQSCEREEKALRDRLFHSRSAIADRIRAMYEEIERTVMAVQRELESAQGELSDEEMLLFAEYSLDFAQQAADRALLISLEAMERQEETALPDRRKTREETPEVSTGRKMEEQE